MKKSSSVAMMAAAFAVIASAGAYAQTKAIEPAPPPRQEMDPAKRVPEAPRPVAVGEQVQQPVPTPQHQSTVGRAQPYTAAYEAPTRHEEGRGGFFVGVQGGKGWVYDDVDQSALAVNAGYRWQAGAVTLIGIELASGRLDSTTDDGWRFAEVDYASIGVNARFNFGHTSPVYALVRAGYMSADYEFGDIDGGYVGVGLGVDITRHFNLSLVYTNYVYFNEAYWDSGTFYYDADRADTLMLGAEARF
ncbi:outer membrane protein [Luteimonas terricola]|uniref:Outer membrane protein beta-barrel domain-containing protein n=1 Tax=Luteimonas terricola TaxID=645597 RepID=A0ABQ2EB27_9GAMM|nr:hypothetical protein [Luteimonas terricola]GGK03668.1 hypothetical protein GCM10011394_10800 [Luteimonas terricola]